MKKEIAMASALLFGGASGAQAQEAVPMVEQEQLDVSGLVEAVSKNVNTKVNPKFFKQMERRAQDKPNEFFRVQDLPDGEITFYHPEGLTQEPRLAYMRTVNNTTVDDPTGPLNAFATYDGVIIDVDQDGSLKHNDAPDLLSWGQIQRNLDRYFVEPQQTRQLAWEYRDASSLGYASTFKITKDDPNDVYYFGGDQTGFIRSEHYLVEIPIVGTDTVVS